MTYIARIVPQPNFPHEDISDSNAAMLELMLADRQTVTDGHQASERISLVFKIGHPAVLSGLARVYDESDRLGAIDHGVATFEAATSLLGQVPEGEVFTIGANGLALTSGLTDRSLGQYVETAYSSFIDDLPRTRTVIASASERYFPHYTDYAVLGAALVRQFELDAL